MKCPSTLRSPHLDYLLALLEQPMPRSSPLMAEAYKSTDIIQVKTMRMVMMRRIPLLEKHHYHHRGHH